MTFRISGIGPAMFEPLFTLGDEALRRQGAMRCTADSDRGYPCRVSLEEARAGEEVLLLPFRHQPADSPYRASGPIFVRRGVRQAVLAPGEVPAVVATRQISLRAYDAADLMIAGSVQAGGDVAEELGRLFGDPRTAYVHLHNAGRGCFSCAAARA